MLYRKQRKEVFRMPKYIAVYNNKGGSSKTTISYQIATLLSKKMPKKNILVIDMDEQVNITKRMTGTEENENPINRLIVDNLFVRRYNLPSERRISKSIFNTRSKRIKCIG